MPSFSRRLRSVAVVMAVISAAYMLVNRCHFRAPMFLPLSFIDNVVPFSPWAMPLYFSHFIFLPLALLSLRTHAVFLRTLKSMSLAAAIACVIFLVYPTTFPRVLAPGFWLVLLNSIDTPANCFPSMHVALAVIAAWGLRADNRPWAPLGAAWALLIALSTVLVKQHYVADVAGGLVLAVAASLLAARTAPDPSMAGEPA